MKFQAFDPNKTGAVSRKDFRNVAESFSTPGIKASNKLALVETMFLDQGDVFNYVSFMQFLGAKVSPAALNPPQAAQSESGPTPSNSSAGATGKFRVGMAIDARYGGKETWYSGKVCEVHGDGTYSIEYADGDKETNIVEEFIRPMEEAPPASAPTEETPAADTPLEMGLSVEAKYGGKPIWYGGKILGVHGDGTYDIMYDDGDAETQVPRSKIRTIQERSDVCPLALHPVLSKMSFAGKLELSGCVLQDSCNGLYLLNHSTYKGYPMYKKLHQEQYMYFVTDDNTWNISNAIGSTNVCIYAKQKVYDVREVTKPWRELKEDGSFSKNKEIQFREA
jgi:hypothetical protein